MADPKRLIHEIHRRSLWQVLGIYLLGSWIGYQIILALTEGLRLPAWFPALAIVLFIIGLPVVLATAFVQEGAPVLSRGAPAGGEAAVGPGGAAGAAGGIEAEGRLPPGPAHRLLTWRNAIVGGVVAFALWGVVAAAWLLLGLGAGRVGVAAGGGGSEAKSIAVLPFANMSAEEENEYFSDGITDEIITQLSKIGDLKVISRTSVMEYKGKPKNLRQIGRELGVAAILEGGVRREGDRVRINAQLVDARTDEHLWAETYERRLTDIFAIQADLALQIAAALRATLAPAERERVEATPTADPQAYEFYLRGNDYGNRSFEEEDFRIAIRMYEKALELDPRFALAHAALSRMQAALYWHHYDRSEARLASAKRAADRALHLDPELPEAHVALGYYHYWGRLAYEQALQEFAFALRSRPNDADVLASMGYVRRRQGRFEEAVAQMERAAELNPRDAVLTLVLGETRMLLRDYGRAERDLDRAIALSPDFATPYYYKTELYVAAEGSTAKARAAIEQGASIGALIDPDPPQLLAGLALLDRNAAEALDRLSRTTSEGRDDQFRFVPNALLYAQAHGLAGDRRREQAYYDSARSALDTLVREHPEDPRFRGALGIAYAGLGRGEDAVREGERGVELLPLEREAYRGVYRLEELARIHAMLGEQEAAIAQLERLLSIPSGLSVPLLRLDPVWDPLRDHPRFQRLVAEDVRPRPLVSRDS